MKKVVLIIALLFLSVNSFAKNNLNEAIIDNKSMELNVVPQENDDLYIFLYTTSCGHIAMTCSYEMPSYNAIQAWEDAMDEFFCEML